jgi:hypothetical protein
MTAARRLQPRRGVLVVAFAVLGLGTGACSRAHITPTHGRAFHEVFAIQDANPNRGAKPKSISGLDSQEAAIIAGSYRKALAPKDSGGVAAPQLLMVSPNAGGGASAVVAPSVPSGN